MNSCLDVQPNSQVVFDSDFLIQMLYLDVVKEIHVHW